MRGRIAGFIAGVTVTVLVGAAAVTAAVGVPDSNGVIHACLATATGQVRIVAEDSECRMNEAVLSWNQEGPEGKQGPAGESADLDPLLEQMVTLETRLETLEDQVAALAFRVDELTGDDPLTDSDGDGYPDESDVCPNVPHTADLDADCIPDELDSDPNSPPACDDGDPLTIDTWDGVNGTCVHESPPEATENIGPYGSNVGECVPGVMNFTTNEILVEAVGPTTEVLDGLDNDCDGPIDEGFELPRDADSDGVADADDNCPAIANADQKSTLWPGLGDVCVGFSGTDVGACEFGVIDMNTGQLLFAGVGPAVEVFNGVDDDCDGQIDEGVVDTDMDGVPDYADNCRTIANPDQKSTLWPGVGDACVRVSGTDEGQCVSGLVDLTTGVVLRIEFGPRTEVVNGLDDDCDGQVDEG